MVSHYTHTVRRFASPLTAFMALIVLAIAVPSLGLGATLRAQAPTSITAENQRPGTTSWQLHQNGYYVGNDAIGQIKGYASATSVYTGNSINFFVSVNPAQTYSIAIYRMGWYGGTGGRLMLTTGTLYSTQQPTCPQDGTMGLIECNWALAYTLNVPSVWMSGVYVALLTNEQHYQNYIVFTVRDDRVADFLYIQSVMTYQAYNNYPEASFGKSLYEFNSSSSNTVVGSGRAAKVSFDRPYARDGDGQFFNDSSNGEVFLVQWLEMNGYDVTYATDMVAKLMQVIEGFAGSRG